jgi:hypothetical protein
MRRIQAFIATGLTLGLVALATPAQAQSITFTDPRGDNEYGGLDIIGGKLSNRTNTFTARIGFAANEKGDVILEMFFPDSTEYDLVVQHTKRPGSDRAYLHKYNEPPVQCDGLSHVWNGSAVTFTLRIPASCMNDGTYDEIHAAILTEGYAGDDSDHALGGDSPWIPRG